MNTIEQMRRFIALVEQEAADDQLFEMANVTSRRHGISNVVIWVGLANKQHGLRIKVSNLPNRMDVDNCFVIMMPSLDYDPDQVANWITPKIIKQILQWIKLNQELLYNYDNGLIHDTDEFLDRISKV